jgi:hypothetical protein
VHAEIPSENVPTGQFDAVKAHDVAPSMLYEPITQGWQKAAVFAPVVTEKDPASHGTHVELIAAPTNELYVPGSQGVQADIEKAPVTLL